MINYNNYVIFIKIFVIIINIIYYTLCGCIINTKIHKYNGVKYNIQFDLSLMLLCLESLIPIFVRI